MYKMILDGTLPNWFSTLLVRVLNFIIATQSFHNIFTIEGYSINNERNDTNGTKKGYAQITQI